MMGEALYYDRAALNGRKEVLNVVEDTLKDDKKGLKGDREELKGNGVLLFCCIYIHIKVDSFLYILSR